MKTYKQPGDVITIVAAAVLAAGAGVLTGSVFGVTVNSAAIGDSVEVKRTGVFTLPKVSAQTWAIGDKIYWDNAAKNLTNVASGNTLVGAAAAIAANGATSADVLLDGVIR